MREAALHLDHAARLPENVLFGTSSWTYPGWRDLIYHGEYKNEKAFKSECLAEYARFPWFRTVGIDSTFYGPPRLSTLQRYASQVPSGFQWVSKVWEAVTVLQYPKHKRYGARAGTENDSFLDAELFTEKVLRNYREPECAPHTGPFVFQFASLPLRTFPPEAFLEKLDAFLGALPDDHLYATEIRNEKLLCPDYFEVLNRHGATHCFNHWTWMPPLLEQMKRAADAGGLAAPFYVSRILTPLKVSYSQAVERFQPYEKVQEPNEAMRDDVVRLARRAIQRNAKAFIIVNNRSEGNSPMTIDAVGSRIVDLQEQEDEGAE